MNIYRRCHQFTSHKSAHEDSSTEYIIEKTQYIKHNSRPKIHDKIEDNYNRGFNTGFNTEIISIAIG